MRGNLEEKLTNIIRKEGLLPKDADYHLKSTFFQTKNDIFMEIYDSKISEDQKKLITRNQQQNL